MTSIAHCGCVCEVMERLFGTKIVWNGDMHATNGEGYCWFGVNILEVVRRPMLSLQKTIRALEVTTSSDTSDPWVRRLEIFIK